MSAPLPTSGGPREAQTWQELEDVFAALGQLARSPAAPPEFYRAVLDQSVRALSAVGAAAWLRTSGAMQCVAQVGRAADRAKDLHRSDDARRQHEASLLEAIAAGHVLSLAPHTVSEEHPDAANSADHLLVLGPVHTLISGDNDHKNHSQNRRGQSPFAESSEQKGTVQFSQQQEQKHAVVAVIELWLRGDASPATRRGCEQYLAAVCELAADYHAFHELRQRREAEHHRSELLELGPLVHSELSLSATAYAVANEGRRVVDCDRLSVLVARGNSCKLLAASGVSRVERRSGAARQLAEVAELVHRTDERAYYNDGECHALPPVAEAIARHVEESHARHIAAIPVRAPRQPNTDDSALSKRERSRLQAERPQFVLIAEHFHSRDGELRSDWLLEVAEVSRTALYNALAVDRMPLGWLLRPLGRAKAALAEHVTRTAAVIAAVVAAIAALIFVPAEFTIEAPGTMQPTARRDVFAPRNGVVDEVLVKHGADVKVGQPLVRMRDPSLELELKRVDGDLETAQRQLEAVRATKTNRAVRDASPVESYRLSAEERELEQKVANSRRELELLTREREQLLVTSPIAGRVLTWDVGHELSARPVERGEVLLAVADVSSPWQLELEIPDDRVGFVLASQKELKPELPVRFRLGSEERAEHDGHIAEICQMADVPADKSTTRPRPTVLAKVALDSPELATAAGDALRPGVSARAQINCGRRSLGYVWLHDVWDALVEWWRF